MNICRLCRDNPANQTGSHIFTLSLIKSAINEEGESVRGKELMFGISSTKFFSFFFGQKIQPETVEKILNKEGVSEEDIHANKNSLTINFIVCTECEKLFQPVENYFFENVQNAFKKKPDKIITSRKHGKHMPLDKEASLITRIFFYIQIWRASVANTYSFKLDIHTEEKLRKILIKCLKHSIKEVKQCALKNERSIKQFPIIISHLQTMHSQNVVYVNPFDKPDFFILNEFIFQFYRRLSHVYTSSKFHFGLTDLLKGKFPMNVQNDGLIINEIEEKDKDCVIEALLKKIGDEGFKNFSTSFSSLYFNQYGKIPTTEELRNAFSMFANQFKVQ